MTKLNKLTLVCSEFRIRQEIRPYFYVMDFKIWNLPEDEQAAITVLQEQGILHKERKCVNNHMMSYFIRQYDMLNLCVAKIKNAPSVVLITEKYPRALLENSN